MDKNVKYVKDVWKWKEEDNTWQNRNIKRISRGIYLISGMILAAACISAFRIRTMPVSVWLLVITVLPLFLWGYVFVFGLDVVYCARIPKNADSQWRKFHMRFPAFAMLAQIVVFGLYIFLGKNRAVTVDTFKLFILSFCIHVVVFFLFLVRTGKKMRTLDNLFFIFLWTGIMIYPFVHSVCYAAGQPMENYEARLADTEVAGNKEADDRYYFTVEFEDGKQKEIEVSGYTYYSNYMNDVFYVDKAESFAGIRFIDWQGKETPVLFTGFFMAAFLGCIVSLVQWSGNRRGGNTRIGYEVELIEERREKSNPFFNRNKLRKKEIRHTGLSDIKGIYFCQMQGLFQWGVLVLYGAFSLFNRGTRYRNIEKILIVWIVAGIIIRMGVECYYGIFVKNEMVPGRFSKYPWKPFTYTGAQRLGAMPVTDMYSEKEELFHHFMKSCKKQAYKFWNFYHLQEEEDTCFWVREGNGLDIFSCFYVRELEDEHMEKMNRIFQKFMKEYLGNPVTKMSIYFTFIICVEKENACFRRMINKAVIQGNGRYRLPVGVVLEEKEVLISPQISGKGIREYNKMKREFREMIKR